MRPRVMKTSSLRILLISAHNSELVLEEGDAPLKCNPYKGTGVGRVKYIAESFAEGLGKSRTDCGPGQAASQWLRISHRPHTGKRAA